MSQPWNQLPQGYQYPMQTGMPFQQQQLTAQPTGFPSLQQPPQQRSQFPGLQAQPTGFPGASFQQPQPTGFPQFQRPTLTGAPPMGFQNQPGAIPPVPPLPSNLGIPQQPNRFLNTSPSPTGYSPALSGPPQGYQPPAPLVAQPTGFMDPRLTMMGSTFMPSAGGGFPTGGAAQFGGATLQQSIAQHNQDNRGSTQQRIPWALSKQERKQYDQIFRAWDPTGSGFLEGQKALEVFGASGLEKNDLIKIWSLADPDDRGKLNREEFHVAMGLIYRALNGNTIPEQLPQELVPHSANSLGESVDAIMDLLKKDNYARNTNPDATQQNVGKQRTFYGRNDTSQDRRKDGAAYKYNDDDDTPAYQSRSRKINRDDVRTGTESPAADLAQMQQQLENAAKRIDQVTAQQAARTAEDDELDRELDDLRRRVKRVQDDLDYVSRGPRSFEKDEDRRKLERELLNLLHERLPEVQRKIEDRERRKKREKDEWSSGRDRRNETSGRYGGRDRDSDRDEYRRRDYDRREEDHGYLRGTFDRDRSRDRENGDRYGEDRYRERDRDGYDRDRDRDRDRNRDRDYDRPRSPPQRARTPPPAPPTLAPVEASRAPPPAPSPSAASSTKNMTPEERQAFIRAEAARRLAERQQRLGLISPSVTPAPDTAVEERLAKEKAEAAEKARVAEEEVAQREAARQARLVSDRGGAPKPASPAPPAPPTPASPPSAVGGARKKAPPPPAPKPRTGALPSAMKKGGASPPPAPTPPVSAPRAPPPRVAAPVPPKAPEPAEDPEEEAIRAREAALRKAREDREARMRELERREEEARLEEQQYRTRQAAFVSRSATSTPVPNAVSPAPPAPPPPVPPMPPSATSTTGSTNPFHRMGGAAAAASPATSTASGFNPFSRPAVPGTMQASSNTASPVTAPISAPVPPPPPPVPPVEVKTASPPPQPKPVAQLPPAPVARPPPANTSQKASYGKDPEDSDEWASVKELDDESDSSDDDRVARQKLAAHLFGKTSTPTPRPESRGSNPRSTTQTPAPITPVTAVAPPPPPPPPVAPEVYAPVPTAFDAPPPPPPAPPVSLATGGGGGDGRSALLQSIAGGARLRPTKTVDRSGVQGAGAVLGDSTPPTHIIHPPRAPSPPAAPEAPPLSNGHAHRESVDWYSDLAANVGAPHAPALDSVTEESPAQYSTVPSINIQHDEPVPPEADPLEDVDMQNSQRVRSLYPYEGQRDEDLPFSENTVIVAHPSKSGGPWWYGLAVTTGKKGFFPHTYVQDLEEVQAIALYPYEAANTDELSFQEGDRITIVDRSEEGWWKTEKNGQIMIVPAAYLELASVLESLAAPTDAPPSPSAVSGSVEESHAPESGWNTSDDSDSDDSSEDEYLFTDSEDETPQTDAQRQEERLQREIERQKVLEAAGLILKKASDVKPPKPPARKKSVRRSNSLKTSAPPPGAERDLPPLPSLSPLNEARRLDDAYERYEAFKQQEAHLSAASQIDANRQSLISNPSTYASTVPPSSPRQPISPSLPSATLPSSASTHSTESKISSLLHFLGGRTRTPGEGGSTTERKTITVSAPMISGPMALPNPSRENSPAFGSSWSSLVDKDALKEIPPHERKRQEAIFELINTESAYVRDLQLIVGVFYASILPILDEKAVTVIFANIEDILLTNTVFFSQLEERQKESRLYIDQVGDLLEKHIGNMGVYMQYCVNQSNAIKILQSMRDSSPELASKLHQLREHDPTLRALDLSSYLLIPMQRITRYPLLIRQILQYTQHGSDRMLIETALSVAEGILESINESIRDQEGQDRLKELSKTLWVGNGQLDLAAPTRFMGQRKLVKEGVVWKAKSRRRIRAVLCSDILVLIDEVTGAVYRIPIPLSNLGIQEASGARDDLGFTISTSYPRGGTQLGLRASSARECQGWLSTIEETRRKCVEAERKSARRQSTRTSFG